MVSGLLRALGTVPTVGLTGALAERGAIGSIAEMIFTDYLFPFELTSALLITAATGAMILTHLERAPGSKKNQRQRVADRMRSDRMSPLPGPGVFATSSSNATPALLPDGSIAPGSVSELVEFAESERVARRYRAGNTLASIESADHPRRAGDTDGTDGTDGTVGTLHGDGSVVDADRPDGGSGDWRPLEVDADGSAAGRAADAGDRR